MSVDAAIASIVQLEELPSVPGIVPSEEPLIEPDRDNDDARATEATQDADPEDDLPLAALAKTLEKPKSPVKGILKSKTYGLKMKPDSNRTFKCPACETWKSSVQWLNVHYKHRHLPQICGICGRTFDLPSSLSRHMYDHNERHYHCNKCKQSYEFLSRDPHRYGISSMGFFLPMPIGSG